MQQKSKTTAGLLAIFLGGIGVHHFYLGNGGRGVLYLLFCWTFIPSIIAFIEGIIYLTESDEAFAKRVGGSVTPAVQGVHYTEELSRLNELKQSGAITEDEYNNRKAQILK